MQIPFQLLFILQIVRNTEFLLSLHFQWYSLPLVEIVFVKGPVSKADRGDVYIVLEYHYIRSLSLDRNFVEKDTAIASPAMLLHTLEPLQ